MVEKSDAFGVDMAGLQSEDVSASVLYILSTPPHVNFKEIIIKPTGEMF